MCCILLLNCWLECIFYIFIFYNLIVLRLYLNLRYCLVVKLLHLLRKTNPVHFLPSSVQSLVVSCMMWLTCTCLVWLTCTSMMRRTCT